ncbi:copia protein [Tanacetum coccineum]
MSRTMLDDQFNPQRFWFHAVEIDAYILNRVLIRKTINKTPYEIRRDVKSAFLNGVIDEEVNVAQPPDFVDFQRPNHVNKLKKALYGLKQDPKAWKRFLILDKDSEPIDSTKFQEDLKVSHLEVVKSIFRYIKGTQHLGLWYLKDTEVNVFIHANLDHASDVVDRKSTSRICTFVGSCLTSWFSKKKRSLANSITESDYVVARRACQQALWMKQAFVDYNIISNEVPILCDDKRAINLTSSPIDYHQTKNIEIRHHFLKDNVVKKHITIDKIPLGENVANILTKPLEKDQFNYLRLGLGLMLPEEEEEKKGYDVVEECTLNN